MFGLIVNILLIPLLFPVIILMFLLAFVSRIFLYLVDILEIELLALYKFVQVTVEWASKM